MILTTLQGYFQKVVDAHDKLPGKKPLVSASVQWLDASKLPTIGPTELLIYLMPDGMTVVTNGKVALKSTPKDGLTNLNVNSTIGSEVYLHFANATLLANVMFHEATHNKLKLADNGLHPKGDLPNKANLAGTTVTSTTTLSPSNINDMAAALDASQPQFVTGIKMVVDEINRPDSEPGKGSF